MRKTELFVGAVVRRDGEVLLVRQSPGHSLAGQWTIPWGRVDPGESPMTAAIREVREEAAIEAVVEGLLGVQELPDPHLGGVALVYQCKHLSGDLIPRDTETDAARYLQLLRFSLAVRGQRALDRLACTTSVCWKAGVDAQRSDKSIASEGSFSVT